MNYFDSSTAHEKAFLVLCHRKGGVATIIGQARNINDAVSQRNQYVSKMICGGFVYRRAKRSHLLTKAQSPLEAIKTRTPLVIKLRLTIEVNATALKN